MTARRLEQGVVVAVARLHQLVDEDGAARDPARGEGLGGFAHGIAHPADLHAPALRRVGEDAVGGAQVSVPGDARAGHVRDEHAAYPAAVGEVQVAKGAGGRVQVHEKAADRHLIEGGIQRLLEVLRVGVADEEVLPLARRVAHGEGQGTQRLEVGFAQLVPGPAQQLRLPVVPLPVGAAQVVAREVAVGVAHQDGVAAVEQQFHRLARVGAAQREVARGHDIVGRHPVDVLEDGLAGGEVAVNVREDRDPHGYPILPRCGLRGGGWKKNYENTAYIRLAFHLYFALHGAQEVLDDGQAQAGSPHVPAATFVHPVEALEDAGQVLGLDAHARVLDAHHAAPVLLGPPDVHPPTGRGVFDGVVEQVEEHLLDGPLIAPGAQVRRHMQLQANVLALGLRFDRVGGPGGRDREGHVGEPELHLARFEPGQLQQVLDELGEALGLAVDDLHHLGGHGGVLQGPGLKCLRIAADGGDGGAQLVGDVGHEVLAHIFQPAQFGDVIEDGGAARQVPAERRHPDGEREGEEPLQGQLQARGGAFPAGARHRVVEGLVPNEGQRTLAHDGPSARLEHHPEGVVVPDDGAFGIGDPDAFDHAVQHGGEGASLLGPQDVLGGEPGVEGVDRTLQAGHLVHPLRVR
ncbi:hypothetical protein STIAU_5392 [Stigmatella aurantiaca DW4/3-1]|uniref:Uncharacterized protein n=1 Tax=Stigmatella aurantiaca (strain DW4/3-1) TaxID=378806 RepID=Q08WL1_STIAD|nr:hypothetical protein STIAU_5392 [Stigmatella aurantiaca DW4/3-1]